MNPNCDGGRRYHEPGEVRRLPWGENQDGACILCRHCFNDEIRYRIERNKTLEPSAQFALPDWESLEIYNNE